ncbi:MAG: succinylglutamate desuccinylase/aspartoacylase family protein [Candidatus Staskawiczbacteria bacterium]|jgi:hypothetical protein
MKKEILFICATHGNEKIGLEIIKNLKEKVLYRYFDYLIANPKALQKNVRFLDCDLNRSYPGNKNSKLYEERRAYEILKIAKNYKYIIDIHEASSGINNFIIAPRKRVYNKFPINLLNLKTVLLWPYPRGPLGSVLNNTIEVEFGMKNKNRKIVVKAATRIIKNFIHNIFKNETVKMFPDKKFYYVYGKLYAKDWRGNIEWLKDFKKIATNKKEFFPLLVGQYLNDGIICYKMKSL